MRKIIVATTLAASLTLLPSLDTVAHTQTTLPPRKTTATATPASGGSLGSSASLPRRTAAERHPLRLPRHDDKHRHSSLIRPLMTNVVPQPNDVVSTIREQHPQARQLIGAVRVAAPNGARTPSANWQQCCTPTKQPNNQLCTPPFAKPQ